MWFRYNCLVNVRSRVSNVSGSLFNMLYQEAFWEKMCLLYMSNDIFRVSYMLGILISGGLHPHSKHDVVENE